MKLPQISARSGWTSATALLGSRAAPLRKANTKLPSMVRAGGGGAGGNGTSAARSAASTVWSDSPSAVPGPQSTRSARIASMHWPKVAARTATPVDTIATSVTPGIACTAARFRTPRTVP